MWTEDAKNTQDIILAPKLKEIYKDLIEDGWMPYQINQMIQEQSFTLAAFIGAAGEVL